MAAPKATQAAVLRVIRGKLAAGREHNELRTENQQVACYVHWPTIIPECIVLNMPRPLKRALHLFLSLAVFGLLFTFFVTAYADAEDKTILSRTAEIDGVELHYLSAGHGAPLILLHGYAETSLMWRPIMPVLAERFTVIAPDLPGIGDSAIPENGLDMKTAAIRIHALARSLGVEKARVVGHDIGLMVAYAYAAQFPAEVEKLVVMDAFLPGVGEWEAVYNNPGLWHFRFNGPTPEALVQGRERTYFEHFWNDFAADKTRSIPEADRKAYATAYARPGRMRAGWAYFVSFQQAAKDFAQLSQTRLTMPVLVIGGEKSLGAVLAQQTKFGRFGCNRCRAEGYRPLGAGGKSQGDDGSTVEVSLIFTAQARLALGSSSACRFDRNFCNPQRML
jgi:pimeloyl-ACP methyl ester carboxylesterase